MPCRRDDVPAGQGVPFEEVRRLAGHVDPRTMPLYDRR
jgi:hypothetical protein